MFEMMAGRSPFDIVGSSDNPDQNTEDYLFQGDLQYFYRDSLNLFYSINEGESKYYFE